MSTVAVVGGGVAGLTAALALRDRHDVVVFEREGLAGGKIRSQRIGGFLFEWGPGGFLSGSEELRALVREVGLDDALTEAGPAAKNRFIYWNGRLHQLPAKPPQMLAMSLLSPGGKLRALGELFVARRVAREGSDDESVYRFMERRFGREVAERIAAPALLGISGGDAASTSLAAVFPRVTGLEREYGSVIRGMMREKRKPGRFCTFADGGMQRLTDRIVERLGSRLRLGVAVRRIERQAEGWRIVHDGGEMLAGAVVVATPSDVAAGLLAGVDAALAAQLHRIAYAPMRTVGIAFRGTDVPAPLDGFGFLAARGSGVRILGATYTSTIVPAHAPAGSVYLRIFMGGAADPEAASLDPERAKTLVRSDLAKVLGITAEPVAYHEATWPKAIPQYALRQRATVKAIEEIAAAHAGLMLTGNAYRGLGVGDTVSDARAVARSLGSYIL